MFATGATLILSVGLALCLAHAPAPAQPIAEIVQAGPDREGAAERLVPEMLATIAAWLAHEFELAPSQELPRIAILPAAEMAQNREQAVRQGPHMVRRHEPADPAGGHNLVAFYYDANRTIFLPEGWTGSTPGELSVLIHEMVHHLQNMAGLRYECAEAREALAFAAQERWLGLFDSSLERELGMTPLTVLVRTRCLF